MSFSKQLVCSFHMIILYLSIVVSLCELVYVSIDCGVNGVALGPNSEAICLLHVRSKNNSIFTFWSD